MRSWTWGVIAAMTLAGCEVHKRPRGQTDEHDQPKHEINPDSMAKPAPIQISDADRAQLRADVLAAIKPFDGRPEYAINDPAFIDPCIDLALHDIGDHAPANPRERKRVIDSASTLAMTYMTKPDGIARLEALVAKRYANPVITESRGDVTIDAGVVAGSLRYWIGGIQVDHSDLLDPNGEPVTSEVIRLLKLGIARYPQANSYEAIVETPQRSGPKSWSYRYDRRADQIVLEVKDVPVRTYVSEKLGGSVDSLGSASTRKLRLVTR